MPAFSVLLSRKSTVTDTVRLSGTVTDLDTDTFRYRILINNQAWTPWTEVDRASLVFSYAIPFANFIAGQANEIKIEGSDEASPSPVLLWSGSVYRYPVQPAVVTVDKPVGEVHKGEPYAFPFSITAPYVKDYKPSVHFNSIPQSIYSRGEDTR